MPRGMCWKRRLHHHGHRMTYPRKLIIQLLSTKLLHPSAKEIYAELQKIDPSIGFTTVYRTLDLLVQMGVLIKLDFKNGISRYELIKEKIEKHHHHLICTECGKIINYDDFLQEEIELFTKIEKSLKEKFKFDIKTHEVQFYGICNNCIKEANKK
jgi:Fur family ferric uptake transcriptional regulator